MSSNRPKVATKRKIISRKGVKNHSKRKAIWAVEDVTKIESTKRSEISRQIDLDTAPHMLISSATSKNKQDELKQLITSTDIENGIHQTAKNKHSRQSVFCDDGVNYQREKSINEDNVNYEKEDDEGDRDDDTNILRYQPLKSPTSICQNEKEIVDPTIEEKENDINRVELSRERNDGGKLMVLEVDVLQSPESNVTRFADNESNSNVTVSSLGEYRSNSNRSDSSEESSHESSEDTEVGQDAETTLKVNITELVNGGNTIWEEVQEAYKKDGKMSKKHRKAIMDAIVQYAVFKKIFIDNDDMADIASQIREMFPTEIAATYFIQIGNKKPSGKLYNLFHRKRAEYAKEERERGNIPEETLSEPTEAIDILKTDGEEDNIYLQKWRETFVYRQKKILEYKSYDDFINEWPIIEKPIGPFLINADFKKIYKKRSLTSHNWNLFFLNNWTFFTKNINEKGKRFCKKVYKLKESPSKDAALSFVLHYLLPPAYGASKWKPTYIDSQNTFLKFIEEECMDKEIENRNEECILRGIKWHPYIIGQGPSKRKIKHFYVVIHNTKIKTENFLSALDLCMKIFIVLNIPYPPESRAVWILVNKIFYNINVDPLMTSRIMQLVHDLN